MRYRRAESEFQKQMGQAGQLSSVDPTVAKLIVQSGNLDGDPGDDKVQTSKASPAASSLSPSQTTMVLEKSIGMAIGMLASGKVGGDLGAMISSDGHILDGHHRWSATILASGKAGHVGGTLVNLPGKELLKVLNVISKGQFGVRNGNPGKGSISQYTPANVQKYLEFAVEKGLPGEFPISPEKVKSVLEKNFGSVENGIQTMSNNVLLMKKNVPGWAPDRKDMPVIEPEQVSEVGSILNSGIVDWNSPHKEASKRLIASNKSALIRLASSLPVGSTERKSILRLLAV